MILRYDTRGSSIRNCSCVQCRCGVSIGIPEEFLCETNQNFNFTCPVCSNTMHFLTSLSNVCLSGVEGWKVETFLNFLVC